VIVGEGLPTLREEKKLSQGKIEERTGLLRCYISRVENGYTVPAVEIDCAMALSNDGDGFTFPYVFVSLRL
jgi:transcriptional regulator with XRE-family HTH domain